ncbi:hypothetical protein [Runella zeae]|jgi:hypothetical protein|uniref:hypothetical protein n=1 Tax=Runella zeae TaxID=94255 RepID=UPI000428B945|nr:hypothetical protein [Runella zeae]
MKFFTSFRIGGWIVLFVMSTHLLNAQKVKEDRNNYAKPQTIDKIQLRRAAPFVYSPHISYKEQRQMQLAKKKMGGITFVVKSRRTTSANYKQQNFQPKSRHSSNTERFVADSSAPFVRYEFSDSLRASNR